MSKWLKGRFGNNNGGSTTTTTTIVQEDEHTAASHNNNNIRGMPEMSAAAATASHPHHHHHHVVMDVDQTDDYNNNSNRRAPSHYSSSHNQYHNNGDKTTYESSTSRSRSSRHRTSSSNNGGEPTDANPPSSSGHHRSSRSSNRERSSSRRSSSSNSNNQYSSSNNAQHHQFQQQQTAAVATQPPQHFQPPTSSSTKYNQQQGSVVSRVSPTPDMMQQQHISGNNANNNTSGYNAPVPAVTATESSTQLQSSAQQSQQSIQSQQRRPAYLLHRDLVIGKGSYGQVCIASRGEAEGHTSSSRTSSGGGGGSNSTSSSKRKKFACKCVMLRNDPKYIAKLQEEVNVLRELRGHDNVIRLYDVFCVDNELFIITELGRGGDLFHLLTTHPKHGVTESYAAKTVAEMLSAVAFLHSRCICHRDLKLENWVLESGKDVWSPLKLIDFGLSTHFRRGQRLSRVVGSSYYVAPEVLKKSYTEACDLWSLGVIVYMLLSGAPPFYGKNDEAIKASIVQGEYTFPHELFRDVSDEAMAFVSTLLSYNIEYRYTAEQALTHPWLAAHLDPDALQKAKDGANGSNVVVHHSQQPSSHHSQHHHGHHQQQHHAAAGGYNNHSAYAPPPPNTGGDANIAEPMQM